MRNINVIFCELLDRTWPEDFKPAILTDEQANKAWREFKKLVKKAETIYKEEKMHKEIKAQEKVKS